MSYKNRHKPLSVRLCVQIERIAIVPEKHRAFLDVFHFSEKNITRRPLGELFGLFSIDPHEKNAQYIPNFLASTAKKEYYAKPHRSASESFESSLQKVNRALGEIAKEGNLSWQGVLDGVVCAVAGNTIHFASCGKARILLLRNGRISELNDPDEADEIHPLKTFTNIASGKILNGDRFILCDRRFFDLFNTQDLEQEIRHCDKDAFTRLLKTALINKLDFVGVLIADIEPDKRTSPLRKARVENTSSEIPKSFNPFGRDTFLPKKKETTIHRNKRNSSEKKAKSEFIDEKGHYYLRQDFDPTEPSPPALAWLETFREYIHRATELLETLFSRFIRRTRKRFRIRRDATSTQEYDTKEVKSSSNTTSKHVKFSNQSFESTTPSQTLKKIPIKSIINQTPKQFVTITQKIFFTLTTFAQSTLIITRKILTLTMSFFRPLLPHFSLLKSRFLHLDRSQKIIVLLSLLLIFSSPFIITHQFNPTNPPTEEIIIATKDESEIVADTFWREKWEQEQSIRFLEPSDISTLFIKTNPNSIFETYIQSELLLSVSPSTVSLFGINTDISATIPDEKTARSATYMADLGLLFLLTEDNTVLSWSPATNAFSTNTFPLPETATQPEIIGAFLTYLYVFDSANGNLFRFPRETGGFGEPVSWLRESITIDNPTHWSIDEFLYIANEKTSVAFSQGRKLPFSLESSFVPLQITDIFAIESTLFILDKVNGRIAIVNPKTNTIQENIVSESLLSSTRILGANAQALFVHLESGEVLRISR